MRDFGQAAELLPEAFGQPGERTFRLRVQGTGASASLWLEKEQLAALILTIRQLLEQMSGEPSAPPDLALPAGFPEAPDLDFKIGRLGIGYDEGRQMVVIFAYELGEEDDDASPAFACQVSRTQCETFAERAEEVVGAGRPICLLCGGPIDSEGHTCPRRNGHSDQPISLE